MSKVFVEQRDFYFVGHTVKHDNFWNLPYAICQAQSPLFCLMRLADTSIGGKDKVKYYVSQIDRLLEPALKDLMARWTHSSCQVQKVFFLQYKLGQEGY